MNLTFTILSALKRRAGDTPRPRPVSTVAGALWAEYTAIHGEAEGASLGQGPEASLAAYERAALQKQQAALCLSGGGIRSASFGLGALQALARSGLLTQFHYLSTVSGGGYIGGWLTAMLHERGGDAHAVQAALASNRQPPELVALRRYTSFLAPSSGLFSLDVWAGITLWARNVAINWMIFFPALLVLALIPLFYADLIAADRSPRVELVLLIVALAGLGIAVYNGAWYLPSHVRPSARAHSAGPSQIMRQVAVPAVVWIALVPIIAGPWLGQVMPPGALSGDIIPILACLVTFLAGLAAVLRKGAPVRPSLPAWTLATLASSAILWIWLSIGLGRSTAVIAVFGPLAVASSHLVVTMVFVSLRGAAKRGDLDREWMARLSGEKFIPPLLWTLFAAICVLLPPFVLESEKGTFNTVLIKIWVTAGPVAAFLGKIAKNTPGHAPGKVSVFGLSLAVIADVLALIFGVVLFMLLAGLAKRITGDSLINDFALLVLAALLAWSLGQRINVNRFSMHAVYRNRLVRGFLGPVRQRRNPDPFTGMDPRDNPRMHDLIATGPNPKRLFPVINTTLNLVAGHDTARKERMAESFTITPTASGSANLHRIEDVAAGLPARGAYVASSDFAGDEPRDGEDGKLGISLGTAMTLSGAAISPSMGYQSSPATAFLMTLFNVRLGAWLPNPAVASARRLIRAKPENAVVALTREILGLTNDQGSDIYLTDGGHFENLGLYEMIRRRCRHIVVIDAGEDPDAHFVDLGNAVRRVRIDFDVEIAFEPAVHIGSRSKPLEPFYDFACATIRYPEDQDSFGDLIYLKMSLPKDVDIDVLSYANTNLAFPNESTIDQFFTESQFESYRQLGLSGTSDLVKGQTSLKDLIGAARLRLKFNSKAAETAKPGACG
ncbi:MAG: patatin-like phospholipase family protein [Cypionkella sp.]